MTRSCSAFLAIALGLIVSMHAGAAEVLVLSTTSAKEALGHTEKGRLCRLRSVYVAFYAPDGSCMRPFKAPTRHEP
jgi:hypothetical protein